MCATVPGSVDFVSVSIVLVFFFFKYVYILLSKIFFKSATTLDIRNLAVCTGAACSSVGKMLT